ncbi:MAG: RAMP superfamily CRISPR-associated protein, partial [Thermoanaerobaculia bacterium]
MSTTPASSSLVFDVKLTLLGPILTQSSTPGSPGIDTAAAMRSDGTTYLPFSLVKGRIRQSWEELGFGQPDFWFGKASTAGSNEPARGHFVFTDFIGPKGKSGRRHRIAIDSATGAAREGALQVIESRFGAGEPVAFKGTVHCFGSDGETRRKLEQAFRWTANYGAEKTAGFGRTSEVELTDAPPTQTDTAASTAPVITLTLEILDPFCVSKRRVNENLFESAEIIPGGVLRGYLAGAINKLLGRSDGEDVTKDAASGPWPNLRQHFNDIRFSHAFPAKKSDRRPVVQPASLVAAGNDSYDVALCDGPGLIDGQAPEFAIDWKESSGVPGKVRETFGWPEVTKQIRVRTAIDRQKRRAEEAKLFGYEMIIPDGLQWIASVDLSEIDDDNTRADVSRDLAGLLSRAIPGLGKSKARVRGTLASAAAPGRMASNTTLQDGVWIVTLQTPALMANPARLDETSGDRELASQYASFFNEASNGSLELVRYFASQSLAGGYLVHRFQAGKSYAPFLLTDPGSVFVLRPPKNKDRDAQTCITDWLARGLPLPQWSKAKDAYGDSWKTNPFLPSDGFGEIAVNLECHVAPANFTLIEALKPVCETVIESTAAGPDVPGLSVPEAEGKAAVTAADTHPPATRGASKEDATASTPTAQPIEESKWPTIDSRWCFRTTIRTTTELHLGDGGTAPPRPQLEIEEGPRKGQIPDVASVATDHSGCAYIPGTSLKGALRGWLSARGRIEQGIIERVFGSADPSDPNATAGKAEIADAFHVQTKDLPNKAQNAPYWNATRLTGTIASVAIDRRTRTARHLKLFHREYVPPGVAFDVAIRADNLEDEEVALLDFALRGFADSNDPVTLGSDTRDGWGRFEIVKEEGVDDVRITTADRQSIETFAAGNDAIALQPIPPARLAAIRKKVPTKIAAAPLNIPITITFDGPFLVNDPSRTKKKKDLNDPRPNHAPRVNSDNAPVLPSSSLRGALRAQAERIARTLGLRACRSTDPVDACPAFLPATGRHALAQILEDIRRDDRLCITCRLFGATGWASPISFEPFISIGDLKPFTQEFVAIDRFTGGSAEHLKFDAEAYWKPSFEGALSIAPERTGAAERGLLWLTLRDLADGDVTIGFGAAKGYGACTAVWSAGAESAQIDEAIRKFGRSTPVRTSPVEQHDGDAEPSRYPDGTRPRTISSTNENEFHNPYAFVPVASDRSSRKPLLKQLEEDSAHAAYLPDRISGRIYCSLECEAPLVIGGSQSKEESGLAIVAPFMVDGKPAIPASTIRGLISSIAEAASNSALRVLTDTTY